MSAMTKRWGSRVALCLVLAFPLAGCGVFEDLGVSHWFDSETKKSKLKGARVDVLTEENTLKADADLASVAVVLPKPYANTTWPQAGGFADNALYHLEASGPLRVLWTEEAGKGSDRDSRLTAPPVVAGGRIFVLDADTHVFAFDAGNGARLWKANLAPQGTQSLSNKLSLGLFGSDKRIDSTKGFGGGIGSDAGKIFVTTGFGDIVALDMASGKELWRRNIGVPFVNAPVVSGGRIFVSSVDNHLHALAEADGRQLWEHQGIAEAASILKATNVAVSGEYVVVPYTSGELFAIRVSNGHVAWSDTLTKPHSATALGDLDDIAGRPVIDRDMVFAISHSGTMAAINLNTGERAWSKSVGSIQTPWAAGDFLYVLTTENQLLCLERKDGKVKWIHQLPRWDDPDEQDDPIVWSGPLLVSNRLIVTSSNGYAESVSPYTGRLLGRVEIPDGAMVPPVVANQTIYIYTSDAQLVALR